MIISRLISSSKCKYWGSIFLLLVILLCANASANYIKMFPPPDVDKATWGHTGTLSCWLATAANMLAGAGYGVGKSVQQRADDIYNDLVVHYGTANGGWTDTALTWWLNSVHNQWADTNPYNVVTVYGNKIPKYPWANPNGAMFIGNELRRGQFVGLSISRPTPWVEVGEGGHAITCWGDDGPQLQFNSENPTLIYVTDSDSDDGGDVQTYTFDDYTNPNPGGSNEGDGWYFDYWPSNHWYIKHIVTLCPSVTFADWPSGGQAMTHKVVSSYRIYQSSDFLEATDLHYKVGTYFEDPILTYRTMIDWDAEKPPKIVEDQTPAHEITVDWDLEAYPVSPLEWVTINSEFVMAAQNSMAHRDVYFTYPQIGPAIAALAWTHATPTISVKGVDNVCGGYLIGTFELTDESGKRVGYYRFASEYDFNRDPEFHRFVLLGGDNGKTRFWAQNFRFGHSYGMPDEQELWKFKDWMTTVAQKVELVADKPYEVVLDWDKRLPYPPGEDYTGPLCVEFLPQDFNKDCYVDFKDLAIFSESWLDNTVTNPSP